MKYNILGVFFQAFPLKSITENELQNFSTIDNIQIYVSPNDTPPLKMDAIVEEEDTCLIMSASHEIQIPKQSTAQIVREIYESKPEIPGSVLPESVKNIWRLVVTIWA